MLSAAAAFVLLLPGSAVAHAQLLEVRPADGATVEGTPNEIVAVFDDELVTDKSSLEIVEPLGGRVALGHVDPTQPTHLLVRRPQLAVGSTYEARWTAATADGHVERGTWSFTVAGGITPPGTSAPTETAAPASPSGAPTTAPTGAATPAPTAATPSASPAPTESTAAGGDVILPIVAGLAIVLIAAALLLSRRGRPPDAV